MTEEIIYADINILEDASPTSKPSPPKHRGLWGFARWHGFLLWIALAGDVILVTAVITLGIQDRSICRLCPMDWLSHRGKCYWFSKDSKSWNESHADCSEKSSRKLVVEDWEELEFIQNCTQGKYHVWLGLSFTSPEKNWTWVDSSTLDQTLFPVTGPADVNSCGVIKGNRIHSETCSAEFKWICQKEAVPL